MTKKNPEKNPEAELKIRKLERQRCIAALCHLCRDNGYKVTEDKGVYYHVITYYYLGVAREERQRCWATALHGLRLELSSARPNELEDGG